MYHSYTHSELNSGIYLTDETSELRRLRREVAEQYLIFWNLKKGKTLQIDGINYTLDADEILCITPHQSLEIEGLSDGAFRAFIFNRAFYCIHENDQEVSCEGLLFYGSSAVGHIKLTEDERASFNTLYTVFLEEIQTRDSIQGEMLRMLLKRLIIKCTRLAKKQNLPPGYESGDMEVIRKFNLMVEQHFRENKQVQGYAAMLHRSPKTLSHIFEKSYHLTPMQIIHQRVELEARRLLLQTEKSVQQIGFDLGFTEPASFSRYFKNRTGCAPKDFRTNGRSGIGREKLLRNGDNV